ncbi:hypothetical protein [Erythrobacter donghaensis]|uniref:hypothetical protein n=1 Tax=Erythrobacter donghaensis TaxID=267135 RepID=UPI00093F367B|nr:hypothetical protein [Erythrobacter donghaensis]
MITKTQWQYRIEAWLKEDRRWVWGSHELEDMTQGDGLNLLGQEGWELVTVTPFVEDGETCLYDFHFKRRL